MDNSDFQVSEIDWVSQWRLRAYKILKANKSFSDMGGVGNGRVVHLEAASAEERQTMLEWPHSAIGVFWQFEYT